ncbi:hypothetical protein [Larkinella soli]|uniref:hypothetical protein n=1 Tax=Larkinella soli TaxID=1770527 RepID=UPI000FFB71CD|nr:hypothetical protein [Larkinella soli]
MACLALLVEAGATLKTADTLHTDTHALIARECSAPLPELIDRRAEQFAAEGDTPAGFPSLKIFLRKQPPQNP